MTLKTPLASSYHKRKMGKRKSQPKKADESKRRLMTWNMVDSFRPLIDDNNSAATVSLKVTFRHWNNHFNDLVYPKF